MKSAKIGEMNTRITIKSIAYTINANGIQTEALTDVFGGMVWCAWVNAHGSEVYDNLRLNLNDVATVTMRYSSLVNEKCRVYKDSNEYEILSLDNVHNQRRWLELKVRRLTPGR
jgi:SPP1 family predicted phage head-tail adaptor